MSQDNRDCWQRFDAELERKVKRHDEILAENAEIVLEAACIALESLGVVEIDKEAEHQ